MSFPRVVTVFGWFVVVVVVVVAAGEVAALWVLIFVLNARYLSLLPGCVADCQYGLRSLGTQIYFGHYFRFRHRCFRVHPREPRLCSRKLMLNDTWHSWGDPWLMLRVLMRTGPVIRYWIFVKWLYSNRRMFDIRKSSSKITCCCVYDDEIVIESKNNPSNCSKLEWTERTNFLKIVNWTSRGFQIKFIHSEEATEWRFRKMLWPSQNIWILHTQRGS